MKIAENTLSDLTCTAERNDALQFLDILTILFMVSAALAIRLYIYPFNDTISVDGTGYVGAARKLLTGDISGLSFYGLYPVISWLTNYLVQNMEIAALLVSVVSGSLIVVPLYLLGLVLFTRPTAIAACLVTIVWSSHLQVSTNVANHALFTTLALTAVLLVWLMLDRRSITLGCWSGLAMGLAFLTRPEAFLLFFVMPLVTLFNRRRDLHRVWRPLAAYSAVFILILSINILLVYRYTGTWQLAAKTSSALIDTLSYHLNIPDLNKKPGVEQVGYLDFIVRWPDLLLKNIAKNLNELFKTIVPLPLWLLALAGFLSGGMDRERVDRRIFLLCSFAPLGVIIIFYYLGHGYAEPFMPVLFLWSAEGGRRIEGMAGAMIPQFSETIARWSPLLLAASLVYATVLLVPQIPGKRDLSTYKWEEDDSRRDQKQVGLMLKKYLPPGKIMTQSSRIAYYSEREWSGVPNTDLEGIERAIYDSGARFLVLHGRSNGTRPPIMPLYAPLGAVPETHFSVTPCTSDKAGLHQVLLYTRPGSLGVVVYEIVR